MKAKKILTLLMAVMMLLSLLSACGEKGSDGDDALADNQAQGSDNSHDQKEPEGNDQEQEDPKEDDSKEEDPVVDDPKNDELINEDGVKFEVSLENKGEVVSDVPVSSDQIVLAGKSYSFPLDLSMVFDDGWYLQEDAKEVWRWEFKEETEYDLSGVSLFYDDYSDFDVVRAYNPNQVARDLYGCQVLELRMRHFNTYVYSDFDFVLPGGITKNSTAADVLEVFGNPYTTNDFEEAESFQSALRYTNHKQTGMSFNFSFWEDGRLRSLTVEVESPKEINNTGR